MLERDFQSKLIRKIQERFPGSMVLKTDPDAHQGIPDLLILYKEKWAALECKRSKTASKRPNQKYYVDLMDGMSFSRFIYPENKEDVIDELSDYFGGNSN